MKYLFLELRKLIREMITKKERENIMAIFSLFSIAMAHSSLSNSLTIKSFYAAFFYTEKNTVRNGYLKSCAIISSILLPVWNASIIIEFIVGFF